MGVLVSNIIAIYRKELQSYFSSPFAYVITGVFWFISGLFFAAILLGPTGVIAQVAAQDQFGGGAPVDVPSQFLIVYLGVIGSLALFILPMLSMGLYAEERKRGTLELLATSPITNWAVAVGKLLGVLTFFFTMTVPLLIYEAIAFLSADPPANPLLLLVAHGGLLLLAAAVLSLGMFVSSLTDSTILSAVLTFGLMLMLWVTDLIASGVQGPVGEAIGHLSLLTSYGNLIQGIVETSDLVLFASYIVLGIFLTAQSIELLRYQRS
ncbi:MAG: ABC transporter permease [Leptolyngbya sp. DLM2.Bin15]|nr:MAG: ABC transporter permease [Leptolyngbya sp. DLM2.Bin15]